VLKLGILKARLCFSLPAAFGRLCVETYWAWCNRGTDRNQPPSGGCVLKPYMRLQGGGNAVPAAFGRLCVETTMTQYINGLDRQPPSGGCVLKLRQFDGCRPN